MKSKYRVHSSFVKYLNFLVVLGLMLVLVNINPNKSHAAFEDCGKLGDPNYNICVKNESRGGSGGGGSQDKTASGGLEGKYNATCGDALKSDPDNGIKPIISSNGFIATLCKGSDDRLIIEVIIEKLADVVVFLSVFMFSIMIALAGLQITVSGGSPEGIKAGKRRIALAVSSIALIWMSRIILDLIGVTGDRFFGVQINADNPFTSNTIKDVVSAVLSYLQFSVGAASIAFVIVGGIRLMTSAGNPQAIQGAKKTITYALIGLAIVAGTALIQATVTLIFTGSINTGAH